MLVVNDEIEDQEAQSNLVNSQCPSPSTCHGGGQKEMVDLKEKLYAAEQAFERRLGIMETKLSQDLIKERALRETAEKNLRDEKELREQQKAAAAEEKQNAISATGKGLLQQLDIEKALNTTLTTQIETMKKAWEAEKQALEIEADQEVLSTKTESEALLTAERASVQRLRGEAAVLKQRYEDQLHTAKFAEEKALKLSQESKKLRAEVEGLKKDLEGVKVELASRESALNDKESMLREATDRERKLEQKCSELNNAREAATKDAAAEKSKASNLVQQVESLRTEYRTAQKALKAAELDVSSRKQRELAARKETAAQKEVADRLQRKLKAISGAISEAGALIQHPDQLKNIVVHLYQTYAVDLERKDQENRAGEDGGCAEANNKKREHHHQKVVEELKATIARLQSSLKPRENII